MLTSIADARREANTSSHPVSTAGVLDARTIAKNLGEVVSA